MSQFSSGSKVPDARQANSAQQRFDSAPGTRDALTAHEGKRVPSWAGMYQGLATWPCKPCVVGSIPTRSTAHRVFLYKFSDIKNLSPGL